MTAGRRAIRLLRRWDQSERLLGEPMPLLFQRRHNSASGPLTETAVMRLLRQVCNRIGHYDPRFADLAFTAHDFRRLFAIDLVNNGVPIHIGAALLGHLSIQTTAGYVAVFNDEVVRHYQQFLDNRRRLRPDGEYRAPTSTEWNEFEEHLRHPQGRARYLRPPVCERMPPRACLHPLPGPAGQSADDLPPGGDRD
ncbi:tyrosine-type recombinase/integrase [Streptomyces sp. NPDC054854]